MLGILGLSWAFAPFFRHFLALLGPTLTRGAPSPTTNACSGRRALPAIRPQAYGDAHASRPSAATRRGPGLAPFFGGSRRLVFPPLTRHTASRSRRRFHRPTRSRTRRTRGYRSFRTPRNTRRAPCTGWGQETSGQCFSLGWFVPQPRPGFYSYGALVVPAHHTPPPLTPGNPFARDRVTFRFESHRDPAP